MLDCGERWKAVPKAELHIHLEGAMRESTIREELVRHKLPFPQDEKEFRKVYFCDEPKTCLMDALEIIDNAAVILRDKATIARITKEVVIDKSNEGVKLLELRYAPCFIRWRAGVNMPFEDILDAVKLGVKAGQSACREKGVEIYVGLICIAVSAMGRDIVEETVDFVLKHRDDFIGFDIAGNETDLAQHEDLITKVHNSSLGITLHCGEQPTDESVENVKNAILKLHATRIGHGVNVKRKKDVYDLVKERDIHLELCPCSNIKTAAIRSMEEHPIRDYLNDGLNVSANTDDPTALLTNLNHQCQVLHDVLGMDVADYFKLGRNAVRSSFAPQDVKDHMMKAYFSEEAEANFRLTFK